MKQTVVRYGLYSAALIVVIFLATWIGLRQEAFTYDITEIFGYVGIVLSLLFIFFGIRYYRDHVNSGRLTFGKGLKLGLLIALIPAFAIALFDVLYVQLIDPKFYERYGEYQLTKLKASVSADQYEAAAANLKTQMDLFSNPFVTFIVMFLTVFMIGLIISVISALALKRNQDS
jgi:hypothetical protein